MSEPQFTIEQFYKHIKRGRFMAGKCRQCGLLHLPPRPLCSRCLSTDFEWQEIPTDGKLLTYTIIHVAPPQFERMTPYAVGIVQLLNGLKIPGLIKEVEHSNIEIGMELSLDLEKTQDELKWPQWPRYYFKPK